MFAHSVNAASKTARFAEHDQNYLDETCECKFPLGNMGRLFYGKTVRQLSAPPDFSGKKYNYPL